MEIKELVEAAIRTTLFEPVGETVSITGNPNQKFEMPLVVFEKFAALVVADVNKDAVRKQFYIDVSAMSAEEAINYLDAIREEFAK